MGGVQSNSPRPCLWSTVCHRRLSSMFLSGQLLLAHPCLLDSSESKQKLPYFALIYGFLTHFLQQNSMEKVVPCNIIKDQVHTTPYPVLNFPQFITVKNIIWTQYCQRSQSIQWSLALASFLLDTVELVHEQTLLLCKVSRSSVFATFLIYCKLCNP